MPALRAQHGLQLGTGSNPVLITWGPQALRLGGYGTNRHLAPGLSCCALLLSLC